jgi:NAD(P)-dependent dehydrogenase (short-subunit alcohol dehydrogenase family)
MRLKGKVAVVTGGARGIGEAYVRRFVAEGAQVVIGDVLDREGRAVASSLGDACRYVRCDVTSEAEQGALMDAAIAHFGGLDVAIANAGLVDHGSIMETSEATYERLMAVNVKGVFFTCRQAAKRMIARKTRGVLINISSIVAILGEIGEGCYPLSKGAVGALTRMLAVELADHGIRVVAIGPGAGRTSRCARPCAAWPSPRKSRAWRRSSPRTTRPTSRVRRSTPMAGGWS